MRKLLTILLVVVCYCCCRAQTNQLFADVGDYGLAPQAGVGVTVSLLAPNLRTVGTILMRSDPITHYSDSSTNARAWFTNLQWGYYSIVIAGKFGTPYKFNVYTNTLGVAAIASLITNTATFPPNPSTNYYTQAQIDAKLAGLGTGSGGPLTNTSWGPSLAESTNRLQIQYIFTNGMPWYSILTTNK